MVNKLAHKFCKTKINPIRKGRFIAKVSNQFIAADICGPYLNVVCKCVSFFNLSKQLVTVTQTLLNSQKRNTTEWGGPQAEHFNSTYLSLDAWLSQYT